MRVEAKEQVKGYETGAGVTSRSSREEIEKAVPDTDKTLEVEAFVRCDQVDDVYFDRPFYLTLATPTGADARRHREGQGRGARGALPPSAVGADPGLRGRPKMN
jgi:DNA end-binding protein Ku